MPSPPTATTDDHSTTATPRLIAVLTSRELARFTVVGVLSAIAFFVLFLLTRPSLGAQTANVVALVVTAVANTAVNRRVTFAVRGRRGAARHQLQGLVVFAAGWAVNAAALWAAAAAGVHDGARQVVVLVAATGVATAVRFALMRWWVFAPSGRPVAGA